jgi:hypothetical protein
VRATSSGKLYWHEVCSVCTRPRAWARPCLPSSSRGPATTTVAHLDIAAIYYWWACELIKGFKLDPVGALVTVCIVPSSHRCDPDIVTPHIHAAA